MKAFILSSQATHTQTAVDRVDMATWTVGGKTLLLVTNLNYLEKTVSIPAALRDAARAKTSQVLDSGAKVQGSSIVLDSVGSGAFILGH
jgi:hypothetical protein